jgi:hypothetical protein
VDPIWLGLMLIGAIGIAAMLVLYRMANDPVTRVRDGQGREIDADELEDDEPRGLR